MIIFRAISYASMPLTFQRYAIRYFFIFIDYFEIDYFRLAGFFTPSYFHISSFAARKYFSSLFHFVWLSSFLHFLHIILSFLHYSRRSSISFIFFSPADARLPIFSSAISPFSPLSHADFLLAFFIFFLIFAALVVYFARFLPNATFDRLAFIA
jgi:hypothetical protein